VPTVYILLDGSIHKRCVDVQRALFEVHGGGDGKEEAETVHSDDMGEDLSVVETGPLAAAFGNKASLVARYLTYSI
jgi:hypothetical protein